MQSIIVALAGNPNCGKTTLFNILTGKQNTVGNWSGVTVEKHRGKMHHEKISFDVVDLPGCYEYSTNYNIDCAQDEYLAYQFLLSQEADIILNIVDATQLERHLLLTLQLLEQKFPVIVVLNLMDAAKKCGIEINIPKLAEELGCPVIPITASKAEGISALKNALIAFKPTTKMQAEQIETTTPHVATHHFNKIQTILNATIKKNPLRSQYHLSQKIDAWVLNRFLSIPLFLGIMYCLFFITIGFGKEIQIYFDLIAKYLFIDKINQYLIAWQAPHWLVGLIVDGVGQGIYTTLTFIPIITLLYFCLGLLEASGYMARAAFIMDKLMQYVGLPGKSFIPLILGFGCNVPAILAARTLENHRERILTILMTPFMSCGARLAIFALFVSAFFTNYATLIIFCLYLIGILIALGTGFLLQKTLLSGKPSPLVMELPPYRYPNVKSLLRTTRSRVSRFILKAGSLIIPLCALIGFCGSFKYSTHEPLFVQCAKKMTVIFKPMGLTEENWPATVGLFSGIIAKEVVVGTLTALYSNLEPENVIINEKFNEKFNGNSKDISSATSTIVTSKIVTYEEAASEAASKITTQSEVTAPQVLGTIAARFNNSAAAFAYLLFVLLYFPCVSVIAVMARELTKIWALFSVIWTTGIAYAAAVSFYQISIINSQPTASLCWIGGILGAGFLFFRFIKYYFIKQNEGSHSHFNTKSRLKALPTQVLVDSN